jgi:hypothetical protein
MSKPGVTLWNQLGRCLKRPEWHPACRRREARPGLRCDAAHVTPFAAMTATSSCSALVSPKTRRPLPSVSVGGQPFGQPLQALESHVLGELLSSAGVAGRSPESRRRYAAFAGFLPAASSLDRHLPGVIDRVIFVDRAVSVIRSDNSLGASGGMDGCARDRATPQPF